MVFFPSDFPTKILYMYIIYPMRTTCNAYLISLDFIAVITFREAYILRSTSLCSLLQPPATSSLLGPNKFFSTLGRMNS